MIKIKGQVDINNIKLTEIERDKYYAIDFESMEVCDIYFTTVNEIKNMEERNYNVAIIEVEDEEEESEE